MNKTYYTSQKSNFKCEERTDKKAYKEGAKNMKKVIVVLATMLIGMMLAGCGRHDNKNDIVSITTSDGRASVFQSVNDSNSTLSGKELALRNKVRCDMENGETAHIVFKCDACKNEQEFDIDKAWSDVISCDCPEEIDENGNVKEYIAIEITYNQKTE